jgi:bifunctional non-homologous end joining protein LigD
VDVSREDKVLFPGAGLTKGELVDYFVRIAPTILPHVRDRPVSMQRFPDGIESDGFYQKEVPDHFPDWIPRVEIDKEDGRLTQLHVDGAATLAVLADQGCVTLHVWLSRIDRRRRPDRLVFDLDPSGGDFARVREAARIIADLLREVGLVPFLQTTGSRGLHVVVPLDRSAEFDETRAFARDVADLAASSHSDLLTTEQRKSGRGDRIYVDVMRNAYAQTAVAPYSPRARAGAPVATPLDWDELDRAGLAPDGWTVRSIFRRLGQKEDPWKGIGRHGRSLKRPRRRLAALREEEGEDA